jgi:hypothetical protein
LKQLAPLQGGAPASEAAPAEPKPESSAEPPKAESPAAEKPGATEDDEGRKAEEDIKRETAQMPAPQKAAFTKLRYELRDKNRQLKAALEAQKQQGGEKTADPEINAEIERLRAENEANKQRLSQFDSEFFAARVELTDEFKAQVSQPRAEVAKSIGEISERYSGVSPESVVRAVQSGSPEEVARVTADMAEFDRYKFYQLVDAYQKINQTEQSLRANAKETLERIETERRSKAEAQTAKEREEWKASLDSTWEKLVEDFPVLAPIDGADDWNQQVEKVKAFASPDRFSKLTTSEKAQSLYRAAAFPVLVSELDNARASLKELQTKLSKYEGASPSVETTGSAPTTESGGGVPNDVDISTALAMMLKKQGIA